MRGFVHLMYLMSLLITATYIHCYYRTDRKFLDDVDELIKRLRKKEESS